MLKQTRHASVHRHISPSTRDETGRAKLLRVAQERYAEADVERMLVPASIGRVQRVPLRRPPNRPRARHV